ncbi:MAG: Na(+)-transporting NADH-quinone reductase subunit B [Simkaniaceae bacterium]
MLRKFFENQLSLVKKGKKYARFRPLVRALDTFFAEPDINTASAPHVRDAVDLKRWMVLVIFALVPCTLMAIWNTGVQKFVYASGNPEIMNRFFAIDSFQEYFSFIGEKGRVFTILQYGLLGFLPILVISYAVGLFWEGVFAVCRGHEVSEGFLVSGILFALILPPTIPYWMVVVGVSAGIVIGKEVFGGTGMNILNPALTCRAFLFFAYPTQMTGPVWAGTNSAEVREKILEASQKAENLPVDGYSQASALGVFNISPEIKRVHVEAIATNFGNPSATGKVIQSQFSKWASLSGQDSALEKLPIDQLKNFVTSSIAEGGLGLSPENFDSAYQFAKLKYGHSLFTDGNFFFGNMLGSLGETSTFACLLGALFLILVGVGSWRIMAAMGIGAYLTALLFQWGSKFFGAFGGAFNPAKYDFPAYKHLILGGFAFALAFMATDPVSSPGMKLGRWIYGFLIGFLVIFIRLINPAFPEGVMLAILFANVFAPMIDHFTVKNYRRVRRVRAKKITYE